MSFFNKKEDVISIELTPHGRNLLSKGKLKPAYYTFIDDDILYESQRGGFSENNSQTKSRILSETIYMKPQTNYRGVETNISDDRTYETENKMLNAIGTNKAEENKTSAWKINFLHNTSSATSGHLSNANSPTMQIPQIDCTIEYKLRVGDTRNKFRQNRFESTITGVQTDNREVLLDEQQVLLSILETNGFNYGEGLEIEVLLYEQDKQKYKKLNNAPKEDLIVDGILLESESNFSNICKTDDAPIDPDFVESWLNIRVDDDISLQDRCSGLKNLHENDIYLDVDIKCPDADGILSDIYSTSISEIEDCEE